MLKSPQQLLDAVLEIRKSQRCLIHEQFYQYILLDYQTNSCLNMFYSDKLNFQPKTLNESTDSTNTIRACPPEIRTEMKGK